MENADTPFTKLLATGHQVSTHRYEPQTATPLRAQRGVQHDEIYSALNSRLSLMLPDRWGIILQPWRTCR